MDSKRHLCDSCRSTFPTCHATHEDIVFGNGKGNDNVMECQIYKCSDAPVQENYKSSEIKKLVQTTLEPLIKERGLKVDFFIREIFPTWFDVVVNYKECNLHLSLSYSYMDIYYSRVPIYVICDEVITKTICCWNNFLFEGGKS